MKDQYIGVRKGDRKKIAERFKVTLASVSDALHFKRHTILNREMRNFAMNALGGYYVEY